MSNVNPLYAPQGSCPPRLYLTSESLRDTRLTDTRPQKIRVKPRPMGAIENAPRGRKACKGYGGPRKVKRGQCDPFASVR